MHLNFVAVAIDLIILMSVFTLGGAMGTRADKRKKVYEQRLTDVLDECQDILSQERVLTAMHVARFNVIRVNMNLRPYQSKLNLRDLEGSEK